jgi:hypothetical protein
MAGHVHSLVRPPGGLACGRMMANPVTPGLSSLNRQPKLSVRFDDVPIAGGLVVGGEPEQRFE